MNATETKLVSYLEQKKDYPPLVQNAMEMFTRDFLTKMKTTLEVYATKCQPILDDKLKIPVLAQQQSEQLLRRDDDAKNRTVVTPAVYAQEMRNMTEALLFEDEHSLDSDERGDTDEEVENLLRLYSKRLHVSADAWMRTLSCRNVKSLLFVPIIMKLMNEFGHLYYYTKRDVVDRLLCPERYDTETVPMQELFDERCVIVLQRILHMGLITPRDFVRITDDCMRYFRAMFSDKKNYFSKHRFRFLSHYYPEKYITHTSSNTNLYLASGHRTIEAFRCVFATGLSLYPKKKGINLLHRKGRDPMSKSPYMKMCAKHGRKATGALIHETLQSYNSTPYDPVDAFLYAAIDNTVRLDGVYSMLRTHPDILQLLLLSSDTTTSKSTSDTKNFTTASLSVPAESHRKRKR